MVKILDLNSYPASNNTFTVSTVDEDITIRGEVLTHPTVEYNILESMSQYEAFFSEEIQDLVDMGKATVKINNIPTRHFHPFRVASKSMKVIVDKDYDAPMPITSSAWEKVVLAGEFKSWKMVLNMINTSQTDLTMWARKSWSIVGNKKFTVSPGWAKSFNVEADENGEIELFTSDKDNSCCCVTSLMCDE